MGCRILFDPQDNLACLYCSTTDTAFGQVFYSWKDHTAQDRAEAFLRWLESEHCPWVSFERHLIPFTDHRHDPRTLTDAGLQDAYTAWLAQEGEQEKRETKEAEVEP